MVRAVKTGKTIENKNWYFIILVFLISSFIRTILAISYSEFNVFFDELVHWKIAGNIADGAGLSLRGYLIPRTDILYSLIISIANWVKDPVTAHQIAYAMNALMMSSVVFPVFLLAGRLKLEKKYIYAAVLLSVLVPELTYTGMILQENLMYPLAIWYLVIFLYTMDHINETKSPVFLGVFCFILCLVKDFSLSFFVGTVLFFLTKLFSEKQERKRTLKVIGMYAGSFLLLWLLYRYFIGIFTAEETLVATSNSIFTDIKNNILNLGKLVRMIYPIISYFIFAVTFFGFFTVLLPLTHYNQLSQQAKDLLKVTGFTLFSYIGVICSVITMNENYDSIVIRIHYRYFFFLFIPFLIIFFSLGKTIKTNFCLFASTILYFIILGYVNLIPIEGSIIDFPTGKILQEFQGEMLKITVPLLVIIIVSLLYILLKFQHKRLFLSGGMVILIFLFVNDNFMIYRILNIIKNSLQADVEDTLKINQFIDSKEDKAETLIVGNNMVTTCFLEQYFKNAYRVTTRDNLIQIVEKEDFSGLQMFSVNGYYISEENYYPQYIITEREIQIKGYKKEDLELTRYCIYSKDDTQEEQGATIISQNIYQDYWVNKSCQVMISGNTGEESTEIKVMLDTNFVNEMEVELRDTTGRVQKLLATPAQNTYTLTVYKNIDEKSYQLTFSTDNSYVPNNGDIRELSFRILEIDLVSQ